VVEDDDTLREAVAFTLSAEGYEIVMTGAGEEAMGLIADLRSLDGLYTDIQLSGSATGWEVGEAFHRKWPMKPIAYASAREWPILRLMPTGQFLQKPFSFEALIAALKIG
jgi:DNA-binding response OmpR family regulator